MFSRRKILTFLMAIGGTGAAAAVFKWLKRPGASQASATAIRAQEPLGSQWPVQDPFLFCVHHHDRYPRGMSNYGPESSMLLGRDMGQDFDPSNPFRMYHGREVPGFPVHPHRGFETITIVRRGYVDHADSVGAAGRYGEGDVQWMTAGTGVQHSEMFPLLKKEDDNTLELFQIWLNLPQRSKTVPAHFKMFWSESIPQTGSSDGKVKVSVIAGELEGQKALAPPPDSWAADPQNEVSVLLVKFEAGGALKLPAMRGSANRMLYFFEGQELLVNGVSVRPKTGLQLESQVAIEINSPGGAAEALLLQAKPIAEPVFQHGPFVMNSREDIIRTIQEYQRTEFGGWPWPRQDMVHGSVIERFAKYPDGRIEKPKASSV